MSELETLKVKTKEYMNIANKNWLELQDKFYVCYSYGELISSVIYELFKKDIFDEVATYYKKYNKYGNYGYKVLCELEENIYFEFVIYNVTGMFGDNGDKVCNGKFRIMKYIPQNYKDIYELLESEEIEDE